MNGLAIIPQALSETGLATRLPTLPTARMPRIQRGKGNARDHTPTPVAPASQLRIIGGEFRGRTIRWSGDMRTRPMKDNLRESLFNLVGGWIPGRHAIDLFAGTGAIGLEALSRGAVGATLIERHFPTARIIRENIESLGDGLPVEIVKSDTFFWVRQFVKASTQRPEVPWVVFCSPPWNLFQRRAADIIELLAALMNVAPPESVFAVESDDQFDPLQLPNSEAWRIRHYPPALLSILRPDPVDLPADTDT